MKFNSGIQGLRGFSGASVFFFHIWAGATEAKILPHSVPYFLETGLLALRYGVQLFFIISGYLITKSILRHGNVRAFLYDRAIRIYPAFLIVLLFIFALGAVVGYDYFNGVQGVEWLWLFLANLFFIPGVFPMEAALLVAWTLSYEAAFYLFCAGLYKLGDFLPAKALVPARTVLVVVGIALFPITTFFLIGAAVHFLEARLIKLGRVAERLGILAVAVLYLTLLYREIRDPSPMLSDILLLASLIAGFIAFLAAISERGPFSWFLRTGLLQWLGAISYSLYLWHTPVMFLTKRISIKLLPMIGGYGALATFTLLSIAIALPISWMSYVILEKWAARFLKGLVPQNATRAVAA